MQTGMMIDKTGTSKKPHLVPRRYVEPILYLADRVAQLGKADAVNERKMVGWLAESVGMPNFRHEPKFRTCTDQKACDELDLGTAKKAALVVLALVMKSNPDRPEEEKEYFHKIRSMLEAEPISVPSELEDHKRVALDYLGGHAAAGTPAQ